MVQVQISDGILEGAELENEFGGKYYSFKGIPFAEPPVGDLRFQAPRPVKPWTGVRSALEHGPQCFQFDLVTQGPPSGSEDCLYLNVYSPELKPSQPLPVMVFIHGGAFTCGSGDDDKYGPEFLVKRGVILVTLNYRVEALGFLCLHTEDMPGNQGMKDQVAALRWVKNNIARFGGDKENITIFGESAGAASVTFHLVSPMTKGLFRRAIAQSGTATCWWVQPFAPRERAIGLAKQLGCDSEDDKTLYEFFKSQPVENLVKVNVKLTLSEVARQSADLQFGIVDEKQFGDAERYFHGDIYEALRKGIHDRVDVIAGYCEHEGLLGLVRDVGLDKILANINNFREALVPRPILLNNSIADKFEVGKIMKKFYYKNQKVAADNLEPLVNYYGMSMFNFGVVQFHKICAKHNPNKTYLYKFTCKSERNILGHVKGLGKFIGKSTVVCHADDLAYMFPMKVMNFKVDKNSETFKMIDNVVTLWTNFAKYGNPTPDNSLGVTWTPYQLESQHYLDIGNELKALTRVDHAEMEFWEEIFRRYLPSTLA